MSQGSESSHNAGLPPQGNFSNSAGLPSGLRAILYSGLAVALAVVAYVAVRATQEQAAMKKGQDRLTAHHGLIQPADKHLAPAYSDKKGRLVADPPSDPAELVDPETLALAHYEGDDDDEERVDWESFKAALAKATGKTVETQPYVNSADEIADVKAGKIQLVALHAADVPYLVNNAGFVPMAVLGTSDGANGNHLVIATGAKGKISSLTDLRGKQLTCTRPDSITGYRAAIAILAQDAGMRPNVDYDVHFSLGQKRSIRGLIDGQYTVAALSADKLRGMLDEGEISASDYRVIYESQVIPRLTFGYSHKLQPELAAKITAAALAFDNAGAAADEASARPMRFFPLDYKQEFAFVRTIDNCFDPRFGQHATASLTPEP